MSFTKKSQHRMTKLASIIELSFDTPEQDRQQALETIEFAEEANNALNHATNYLFDLQEDFENIQSNPDKIINKLKYKKDIFSFFGKFKYYLIKLNDALNYFESDSDIRELNSSINTVGSNLEEQVIELVDLIDNSDSETYAEEVLSQLEKLITETEKASEVLKKRIISYINSNILDEQWITKSRRQLEEQLKTEEPHLKDLLTKD